jgi:predicted transcriptional regulator
MIGIERTAVCGEIPADAPLSVPAAEARELVRRALPTAGAGATQEELARATGLAKQRVSEMLAALVAAGQACRTQGTGRRNQPYRYLAA